MVKEQALHRFFSQFATAYEQNTVPENAALPRITYSVATDFFDRPVSLTASIWSRSMSWVQATEIKDAIEEAIGYGGMTMKYNNGMLWIKPGHPFSAPMSDLDDSIRRIVLNFEAEFIGG